MSDYHVHLERQGHPIQGAGLINSRRTDPLGYAFAEAQGWRKRRAARPEAQPA